MHEVVLHLRQRGLDARVLTSDLLTEIPWAKLPRTTLGELETSEGIPIHRQRAFSLPGDLHYPLLPGLSLEIINERPDVLHIHTYGTYQGFSALLAERLQGIPYILTTHYHPPWSIWGGENRHRLRSFYDRHLVASVLKRASRLILETTEEERLLREVVPDLPPVVIAPPGYAPLPPPLDDPGSFRTTYGLQGPFLLFVGRLASNKGLTLLLKAFARLTQRFPGLSLVLVGEDGGFREETVAEAFTLGLAEKVIMVGHLADERMLASAYRETELLVLPSDYEAFGLVLLEAMAHGKPVVATRVGGIPSVVEDGKNGLLVPPGDPVSLATRLAELLEDAERRERLGRYGQEITVPRYTWERLATTLENIYLEVLQERGEK